MQRIKEMDFVKGVMIVLMVAFHLVYIGDHYPTAKMVVYCFHMPCFLIISGYVLNVEKAWDGFWRAMLRIIVPYMLMESMYIVGASLLPIREHIDHLTPLVFMDRLCLHPLGPYWYLHTLVLCSIVMRATRNRIWLGVALLFTLLYINIVSLSSVIFFLMGHMFRRINVDYLRAFPASWLAILPIAGICYQCHDLHSATPIGVMMAWCVMCLCHAVARAGATRRVTEMVNTLGRNTLPVLLYSPVFTILAKTYQPWLVEFDPSGMIFLIISVPLAIAGSIIGDKLLHITLTYIYDTVANKGGSAQE